jgi:hypothetical protein
MLAVAQAEKADFVTHKKLFDDDLLLGLAQQLSAEQALGGLDGRAARLADDHTLACGQPIGLDHDGRVEDFDSFLQFGNGGADGVVGGGNIVPLQKALGEALAALKHGRGAGGAKDAQAALLQGIHNAQRERQFRSHNDQVGLLGLGQADHCAHVLQVHRNAARNLGDAAIARRAHHLRDPFTPSYRPGQRMFAASRTQDQDFHCISPSAPALPKLRKPILCKAGG